MDEEVFSRIQPREYLKRFLDNNVRPDSRNPAMARKLTMTTGSVNTAVGSAMLKLGRTTAVAGVQATLVEPHPNSPDEGVIEFSAEILATASLNFRQVRSSDDALVLTHYLRQWLDPHIDRKALCVESELLVWHLSLTVYIIDNDGNINDAAVLASVAALRNVLLPSVSLMDDDEMDTVADADSTEKNGGAGDGKVSNHSAIAVASAKRTIPLQLDHLPIVVSFALFNDKALIDPTAEEEAVMDSRLTFLLSPSGDVRSVDKPGGKPLSGPLYESCLSQAKQRAIILVKKMIHVNET